MDYDQDVTKVLAVSSNRTVVVDTFQVTIFSVQAGCLLARIDYPSFGKQINFALLGTSDILIAYVQDISSEDEEDVEEKCYPVAFDIMSYK